MRPISLTMYGFGPFVTETVVEFEKLGKKGIFLITGTTGSGKTSIFDAILYALYGKASGEDRDTNMLKTLGLPDGEKPYVIFKFEAKNNVYVIERNLPYKRKAKKGDGFTDEDSYASITCNDKVVLSEKVSSKKDPAALYIQEVLGVDYKQYKMLSILPQGEFEKFLLAKTEDRKAILQKLFDTSLYERFQAKVMAEYSSLKDSAKDHNDAKLLYVKKVACDEESTYSEALDEAKEDKLADDRLVQLLEDIVTEDVAKSEELATKKAESNAALEKVNQDIGKANEVINNRKLLATAKERIVLLKEDEAKKKAAKTAAEEGLKAKPEIDKEVGSLEVRLKDYDAIIDLSKKQSDDAKFIENANKELTRSEANIKSYQAKAEECKVKLEDLASAGENKIKLEQEARDIESKRLLVNDLDAAIDDLSKSINTLLERQNAVTRVTEERTNANNAYIGLSSAFNLAQAGILAQSLEVDKPCPVCGCKIHPKPAVMPANTPTEAEVNEALDEYNRINEEYSRVNSQAAAAMAHNENCRANLNKLYKEIFDTDIDYSDSNWSMTVNSNAIAMKEEINAKAADILSKIKSEDENIKKREELKKNLPEVEKNIASETEKAARIRNEISVKMGEVEQIRKQIDTLSKNLPYANKAEIIQVISAKKKQSEELQKSFDSASSDYSECITAISNVDGQIKTLTQSLAKAGEVNIDELHVIKNELENKMKINDEIAKVIHARISGNESCLKSIKSQIEAVADINKRLMVIEPVAKTMNGSLSGKEKVELETYVLQRFFSRIIRRANIRLAVMTNNNYELKVSPEHKQNKGKTGLELSVIDRFSTDGLERDVHSLSGGEKFKASLSLALGMSDEISAMSGGIKLDSLFIDEGFGSLDRESLESAIRIINSLTEGDVLVGIISHVDILKERINKQVVVTKDKKGSRVEIVV